MTTLAATGIRVGDRYTLLGKLGEGGESEVWRARDHHEGKEVALKVLRPEVAARPGSWEALVRAYEISSRLAHPHILKLDPPIRDGDVLALPTELAPGGDLRRLCGVSYLEIVPILIEVAQALEHAHERGVVHRDLKPGNVLFDARGHVRLADFGGARAGFSPFTASPQQLRGEPPSVADDVYGLGALAYELLSGHPPFHPRFDLRRVLEEPVPPLKPAHLAPGRLTMLVMTMLAKQPRARPASMRAVLETLDAALNDTLAFAYDEPRDALAASDTLPQVIAPDELDGEAAAPPVPTASTAAPTVSLVVRQTAPERPVHSALRPSSERWERQEAARPRAQAAPVEPVFASPAPPASEPLSESQLRSPPPGPRPLLAAAGEPAAFAPASPPPPNERAAPPPGTGAPLRADRGAVDPDLRAFWGDIRMERVPNLMRLEPVRHSRWPWALAAGIAAAAIAGSFLLHDSLVGGSWSSTLAQLRALATPDVVRAMRGAVEAPLRAMENAGRQMDQQGAGAPPAPPASGSPSSESGPQASGQPEAAHAPPASTTAPARVKGGQSAANAPLGRGQSAAAGRAPGRTEGSSSMNGATGARFAGLAGSNAVAAPLSAGEAGGPPGAAGAAGVSNVARANGGQYAEPSNGGEGVAAEAGTSPAPSSAIPAPPVPDTGAPRGHLRPGVQRLLADAREAESARDFSRAAQDYSQALALDPGNPTARAGLGRANAAFGAGDYAQAVGAGFAALGAGRLEEAQADFQRARGLDPRGREAEQGLNRVAAALRIRKAADMRYRTRADLEYRLEALVNDPQQLDSPAVRAEAASLIREADAMSSSGGTVLRSLAVRLAILLPAYDKPVHLALVSDNLTEVAIPQIGSFGTFARREIDLKPGRYTVIGTRAGYREVRRNVTVVPGQNVQTISVRCDEPIGAAAPPRADDKLRRP